MEWEICIRRPPIFILFGELFAKSQGNKSKDMEEKALKIRYEYNGKFMAVIQKITGSIILSVLWIAFCIPVFTIGPSTKALYHTAEWVLVHDLGYPVKEFFKEFRKQFKKTIVVSIPFLIIAALALGNFYLLNHILDRSIFSIAILVVLAVIFLLALVWGVYLFAYVSFFDGDDKKTSIKTSYVMMLTHPAKSLAMLVLFVLFILAIYNFTFVIVFLPAVYAFFHSLLLNKVFKEYTEPEDWERRQEHFKEEREKYEQAMDDKAQEILHGNGGNDL